MAALDWSECPAVESVPDRLSGAWVLKDTRMPVPAIFENLEAGSDIQGIVEQFHVNPGQVKAVIRYQQNLEGRRVAVVVIGNPTWRILRKHLERVTIAVEAATPDSYSEVDIPFD